RPARRKVVRRRRLGEPGLLELQLGVGRRELVLQSGAALALLLQARLQAGDLGAQRGELLLARGDGRGGRRSAGRALEQGEEQRETEQGGNDGDPGSRGRRRRSPD